MLALLTSCQYNKIDPPQEPKPRPLWERTMTIQELKALYQSKPVQVVPDAVIVGQVISDDSEGNIYKSIYLQAASSSRLHSSTPTSSTSVALR